MKSALALVLAAALVASCSSGPEASDGGGPTRSISFLVFGEPVELQAFRNVVAAFKAEERKLTVDLIEASDRDDLLARLSTSIAGGSPPDLFLLNYRFYAQLAAKNAIEPIEERLEASFRLEAEDFYKQSMDAFRYRGRLMCLPQNISSLVVYYNRTMFKERGVPEPKDGWSWTDMTAAAADLTERVVAPATPTRFGLGVDPEIIRLAPFIWSNGGELVDDARSPTTLNIRAGGSFEALARFLDLRRKGLVPDERTAEAQDLESQFQNGKLGMVMQSRRSTPAFRQIKDFDWDVAPLPSLGKPATVLHTDGYCMTAGSRSKDAAWRFMEFALGEDGQRITAQTGRTVPSLIEVSKSDAFLDPKAKPSRSQVFLDNVENARALPVLPAWPEIEDAANAVLEEGFYKAAGETEGGPRPAVPPPTNEQVATRMEEATKALFSRAGP